MKNFDKLVIDCERYFPENMQIDLEEQFFIHLNSDYDAMIFTYGFTPFETFKSVINRVKKPKRFIIFGCSTGYQLFFWNKLYPDVTAIGIDLMPGRIDWGLEKMAEYEVDNVMMIDGNLLDFPVQDGDLIWQNNLLFEPEIYNDYNKELLKKYDIQIVSYIDIEFDSEFIIDCNQNYQKIDCDNFKLETSWMENQNFYIYSKFKEEDFLFTVNDISKELIIPENLLTSYENMLLSRKNVKVDLFKKLFNKNNLKSVFTEFGFNTPETYFHTTESTNFVPILEKLKSFVAKPCHRSESVDVFCKSTDDKINIEKVSKRLNKSLEMSDFNFFRRNKVEGGVWWKDCEKGVIVEQYINVVYELKVFVVFGIPIIGDLRKGSTEYDRVDFIKKHNKFIDWYKEYELIQKLSQYFKLDFFRIDFLYDGEKLYASEMAVMPGTELPEEIEELIHKNWSRPYIKFYYPQFLI